MTKPSLTLRQAAELIGAELDGDPDAAVRGLAPVDQAGPEELTFAASGPWVRRLSHCRAAAALVPADAPAAELPLLRVDDVMAAVARLMQHWAPREDLPEGVHPSAVIDGTAELADDVAVGAHAVVGPGARVGAGSVLCAGTYVGAEVAVGAGTVLGEGVVVRRGCRIGDRVRIGPNSVIGFDGFGYVEVDGQLRHIPHGGTVVIEDDVHIGACTCVDRAKFDATRIARGAKIDNLVQIGHNARLGESVVLAGCSAVGGSADLGRGVTAGGNAAFADHVTVGEGARVAGQSGVISDVEPGATVGGMPALPMRRFLRIYSQHGDAQTLRDEIRRLRKRIEALESPEDP